MRYFISLPPFFLLPYFLSSPLFSPLLSCGLLRVLMVMPRDSINFPSNLEVEVSASIEKIMKLNLHLVSVGYIHIYFKNKNNITMIVFIS